VIPFDVVGVGPGSRDYLLPAALEAIENADLLVGSPRLLDIFSYLGKDVFPYRSNLSALLDYIGEQQKQRKIALLVSGDPGYHSLLGAVSRSFPEESYSVIPGISSFQAAMARRKKPWQGDLLLSCHGKDFSEISAGVRGALETGRRVILLTDHRWNPGTVAAELLKELQEPKELQPAKGKEERPGEHRVWLAEDMTMAGERFIETSLGKLAAGAGHPEEEKEYRLCVMIIE